MPPFVMMYVASFSGISERKCQQVNVDRTEWKATHLANPESLRLALRLVPYEAVYAWPRREQGCDHRLACGHLLPGRLHWRQDHSGPGWS
jgi:hypothetical protein